MTGLLTPQRQTAGNGLLDQPRRVDDRVAGLLGLDPSIQRGAILPFGRDASGEMVMAWPEMAIDTLKSLMLPGHVVQGGEFTPRDVTEMALDVGMLSTVAPAPAGAKRMFGGISAKNAPLDDLAKAEAMEKAGEAADDIWRATGWGRGADQKWRFEIDDSGADFRDLATRPVEQYGVFGRAQEKFRHPELFGAYDLPYEIDAGRGSRRHGSASAPTHWRSDMPDRGIKAGDIQDMGRVTAKGGTRGEIKQTALHEFQHAVQNAEGFARGGNMSDEAARLAAQREAEIMATAEAALSPADQASLARYRDLATRHRGADVIPGDVVIEVNDMKKAPWFRQFQENIDEIRKMRAQAGGGAGALESGLIDREEAFRQYERLAGEVEARNVERRMDMDAATRRATPPWSTEDVPRDQQIVRGLLGDSGPQMSAARDDKSRVFYRGTNPGNTERIKEPFEAATGLTFVARKPESARMYGESVQQFTASPDARILYDESPEFWKLVKRRRPPNGFVGSARGGTISVVNDAVRAAKDAGYDAVSFSSDADIGTVILNDGAFQRGDILASYLGVPGIGMLDAMPQDDQSRERRGLLNN